MSKQRKRKIVIPFTLEQFKDVIERIKVEYNVGNLSLVGLFEIETLEYYYEKAKDNEQAPKQEKLLELYKRLSNLYEKLYSMELSQLALNSNYYEIEIIKLKYQIKELENEK